MPTASSAKSTRAAPAGPRPSESLSDQTIVGWLRDMMLIREFELRTMAAYQQAKIGGFCHVYNGQEAVAVGTIASVEHNEPIITAYRDHGHALARGMNPNVCMAEMFGKGTGCAKGKGGSMHMFDRPNQLLGGHGIVGAQTPLGAGTAFAIRYEWEVLQKGSKRVCLCYLGDGALNQGAFHEACNLAGLFDLPVIFVVENNGYSMGTDIARGTTMSDDLGKKAAAYGIDYLEVQGFDIVGLYDAFKPFVDVCRERQRPGFANILTYRYQGHSMSDPQKYRSKEEVAEYQERDPINLLSDQLLGERGILSQDAFKQMQREVKQVVRDAIKYAEKAPEPDPKTELYSDVFHLPLPNLSPSGEYREGDANPHS